MWSCICLKWCWGRSREEMQNTLVWNNKLLWMCQYNESHYQFSTDIYDLPSLQYADRICQDRTHRLEIDQLCTLLTYICICATDMIMHKVTKRNAISGWNVDILSLKWTAEHWSKIWCKNGMPVIAIISDIFRKCRLEYHYAIRAKTFHDNSRQIRND